MDIYFFYIFGGLAVLAVAMMIVQTNPVTSALCLVFALFNLAALYVLLHAPFVAVLQVLVYAGAIMVLFVFVIMLLKLKVEDLIQDRLTLGRILIGLSALAFAFLAFGWFQIDFGNVPPLPEDFGSPEPVSRLLFTQFLIPFELTSILLTVAILGAVHLGKRKS